MNQTNLNVEANNEKNSYVEQVEEYTGKPVNILNDNEINHCLENVDEEYKETFINTMKDLKFFKIKYVGQYHFDEQDKYIHNTYLVTIKRGDKVVKFGQYKTSFADTEESIQPTLYDILTCYKLDGLTITDTFEDFCDEMGGNEDSIKDLKVYKAVKKEQEKLFKIFTREELESFPS